MPITHFFRRATQPGVAMASVLLPVLLLMLLAVLLPVLTACSKPAATESVAATAAKLTIAQGNSQYGQAGAVLAIPVILRATDAGGAGVKDVPVNLAIGDGGGSVDPASAKTDEKGEIKAKWTLGAGQVGQSLIASAPGTTPDTLRATGIIPNAIVVVQGNSQSAKVGTLLTNSIVIRVVGDGNVPMVGVNVGLQIVSGAGAISPASAVTGALGEVTVKWTMGAVAGPNSAQVSASTITPALISATGTP